MTVHNETMVQINRESTPPTQRAQRNVLQSLLNVDLNRLLQTFKQSLFSLLFIIGAILAGIMLSLHVEFFSEHSWALAVYPGILSMRGVIGGLFSGRLSTGLHIGTVRHGFSKNTRKFYTLWRATIVLTLESSITLGIAASLFGIFFWGIDFVDSITILGVITATMGLSLILISPITVAVSILSFKRGLDPDVVVYPIISTIADVFVTICYILVLNASFSSGYIGYYLIGLVNLVFLLLVSYVVSRDIREEEFVTTIKESFLTIVSVAFIVNVTGSFLTRITKTAHDMPGIYVVYPALIDTIGAVGSIVGSTATTKLVLGTLKSSLSSIKQHINEIGGAWAASLVMFTLYSIISCATQVMPISKFLRFMLLLFATNILAALSMVTIAYAIGVLTYRKGWDPDNFVIPIESSLADTITTISLLVALNLIGW